MMKKILSVLTLVTFMAVNVSLAQSTQSAASTKKETKTEAAKPEAEATEMHGCCKKSTKACCKEEAGGKSCTSKEKAAAKEGEKAEAKKETKSGTN